MNDPIAPPRSPPLPASTPASAARPPGAARPAGPALVYLACLGAALVVGMACEFLGGVRAAAVLGAGVVALLGAGVVALLGMRDFRVLAVAVAFLLPYVPTWFLSEGVAGQSGQRIVALVMLLTLMSVACGHALDPWRIRYPRWRPAFLAYVAMVVFAALNGARSASAIPEYFRVLEVVVETTPLGYLKVSLFVPMLVIAGCAFMGLLAANVRDPRWLLLPVLSSAVLLAVLVCLFALHGASAGADLAQQESRSALSALGLHANELGLLLNMALALALCALGTTGRATARAALALACLVLMAGVLMTFSRGAFLGLGVVILYALATVRGRNWPVWVLVALALVVALSSDSLAQRALHGIGGGDLDLLSSGRIDAIWLPLLPEILDHPILGAGHASILWSQAAQARTILPVGHPHSAYLGALLDVGIVGSVLTALFFAHAWRLLRRAARQAGGAALAGFFGGGAACILLLLVQGLTDDSFMPSFTHVYFWLCYGAAVGTLARARCAAAQPAPVRGRPAEEERA
ncbi:O-antigen ligase family protein [Massilia timonae]|uniref:O-Antigen ligase family protein n=1 Tax=Massilia timonae TaxID=47229 RepID=A0A1S2NCF4_9BURK|nr:O-antigen ligase family protein [Massilia timonae]OIJ42659.1 O-Antigen ligase family protein [Massilia timonae]